MKTKYKGGRILALLLLMIAVLLCMSAPASAVTYVDGSSNSYTPGSGTTLSGNNYNVHFTSGAIVGYRFSLISKNSSGSYYQVKATDVFYSGSNTYPVSPYTNHLKITAGGTVYRNLSKFAYNNLYSSITKVEAEAYSNSSYSKYTGTASSLGTTITDSAESMKTWCKTASKMNLVLAKFGSYTMANLKDSDRIFVEPLYGLRINGTGYCITVTEMALLGRIFYGDSSTGYEGSGGGYDWLTICNYTNRYYASEMYTSDATHCGISVGSALTSRASFKNVFTKGYGLYVVRCENPHTLTVYYRTGTGDSSLTISSSYKLSSSFSSYSTSYIRNTDNEYYTQSVKYDNSLTLSSGFGMKRNYYTFSKWKDADSSNTFASGATKTASQLKSSVATGNADLTLDAVWTPVSYTITYDLNGGKIGTSTTNPKQTYNYETDVYIGNYSSGATAYTVPAKTGYVFAGWKHIGTAVGYWGKDTVYENKYNKGKSEHGDITLTAQWTPISYTIKYYLDGTEQTSLAQSCKYGTSYTYKALPTKTGYSVSGWNSKSDMSGTAYTAGGSFSSLTTTDGGTVKRYAKSTANSYTVKYYLDGVEQTSLAQSCKYGTSYTYKALPTKTGYTVTGWNSKSDMTGTSYTAGASFNNLTSTNGGTVSRYAKSKAATYTVEYYVDGTKQTTLTQTCTVGASYTYSALPSTATGKHFTNANWHLSSATGTAKTPGDSFKDLTTGGGTAKLYATTAYNTYTVKYYLDGTEKTDLAQSCTYGSSYTYMGLPSKTGYAVSGWNSKSDLTGAAYTAGGSFSNLTTTDGGTVKRYAKSTANSYTVEYYLDGTKQTSLTQSCKYASSYSYKALPTKAGYTVAGWNSKSDMNGTDYAAGGSFSNLTSTANGTVKRYAKSTSKSYTVTYVPNGGKWPDGTTGNKTQSYKTANGFTVKDDLLVKDGYSLLNWQITSGAGSFSSMVGETLNGGEVIDAGSYGNVTLTAQYSPNILWLMYNANGGTVGSDYQLDSDNTICYSGKIKVSYAHIFTYDEAQKLETDTTFALAKTGYLFGGWNSKADMSGTAYNLTTAYKPSTLNSDMKLPNQVLLSKELYAKWTPITYTVEYYVDGVLQTSMTQTCKYDTSYSYKAIPAITGKTVSGWNSKADMTGSAYTAGGSFKNLTSTDGKVIKRYASSTVNSYSITYKWTDGETITGLNPTSYVYGTGATLPAVPSCTGYSVEKNWLTSATGTTTATTISTTATGNKTFYAKRTALSYTVSYDANGGSGAPAAQTKAYNVALTLSSTKPTRTGYTFKMWNTKADGTGTDYVPSASYSANADLKLFAQWTPNTYTVKYYLDGTLQSGLTQTCTYGVSYAYKSLPTKTGYSVSGWNSKSDQTGTAYTPGGSFTNLTSSNNGTVSRYATSKVNSYTITYKWADTGVAITGLNPTSYVYGTGATLPAVPSLSGYDVDSHWFTTATGTTTATTVSTTATGNKTFYAKRTAIGYAVTYNANGGTGAPDSQAKAYNVALTLASGKPTRTGYSFKIWNTKADGTGTDYKPASSYSSNADLTLYAQWTPNTYTVEYYLDDTLQTGMTQTCKYGTSYKYGSLPTKTGYAVTGWNSKSDQTGTVYTANGSFSNLTSVNNGVIKRYASFKPNTYTVNYYLDGAIQSGLTQTCTYDTLYYYAALPSKTGYAISGWNANADMSGLSYSSGASFRNLSSANNGTVKRYAKSVPITYQVRYNGNGSTSGFMTNSSHTYDVSKALTANAYKREFTVTFNYNGNGTSNTSSKATAVFNGWAKSSTGSVSYADKQSVINLTSTDKAVVNVYAKWTDASVTLPSPTRTGYILSGWYTASSGGTKVGNGGDSYTPSANVTVYARWTPITYQIKYNGNGSTSGAMTNSTHTYDVAKNLTANAYKRVFTVTYNYNGNGMVSDSATASANFNGWAKSSTGSVTYTDCQSVKNLSSTNGAVVNVYAKWTDASVTLPSPTRTGYILSGWYTATSGGTKVGNGGDSYTPSADITVYARWTPITYTIKFDGNGATGGSTASMNMTYDVAAKLTENGFARSGYEFVNWNTKADGTGTTYNDMQTVKNLTAVQGKVITLYAVWKPVRVLSLEPVVPNAPYREGTDVITSFYIVNAGLADCVPGDNISVKFTVYKGSTAIKTLTMNNVVVPKNDKNLLYFKWTVPSLSGSTIKITGEIIENGENYGLVSRAYETCANVISATPDTQYEASAPAGFSAPSKLTEKSETVNWSVWIYENNAFVKTTYGYGLKNVTAAITPDPDSHSTLTGSTWTMKSGYGYSLSASGSGATASGYLTPDSTAYTSIQYAYALFPEFGYSSSVNSFRTLELSSGKWIFRTNGNYGRIHFTPLWYPDGNYTASVVLSDCWTPAGMITAVKNANTVNISGSAYDDWFID